MHGNIAARKELLEMTGLITVESKVITNPLIDCESLFAKWIKFAQVKPSSVVGYTKGVKNFLSFARANGIAEITREVLLSYKEYLRPLRPEEKPDPIVGNAGYKASTSNLYLTSVKLFVSFLYQEKIIAVNAAEHIKTFGGTSEGHAKDALDADTVKKIAASFDTSTLKGKRDAALFATMTCCGTRCIEVSRANVGDMVKRRGKQFLYVLGKGRDTKSECVELPPGVYKLIQNYLAARGNVTDDAPLFASTSHRNSNERITTNSISRLVKSILRANDIDSDRVTAHSLRHTCAQEILDQTGKDLRRVQAVLRHRSVRVTERYLADEDRFNNNGERLAAKAFGY